MIERYNPEIHKEDTLRIGREMHIAAGYKDFVWDKDKFLAFLETPNVYAALYSIGDEYVGGMVGFTAGQYFSTDLVAKDLGLFIEEYYRGGSGAIKLIKDFEKWAIEKGAKEIYLSQSTGLKIEATKKFYESLGYLTVGYITKRKL